jgi:hypothetical protein
MDPEQIVPLYVSSLGVIMNRIDLALPMIVSIVATLLGLVFVLHYYGTVAVGPRRHISPTRGGNLAGFPIVFCGIPFLGAGPCGAHAIWNPMALLPAPLKLRLAKAPIVPVPNGAGQPVSGSAAQGIRESKQALPEDRLPNVLYFQV